MTREDVLAGVYAWRCEECGRWHPRQTTPYSVTVMEPGPEITSYEGIKRVHVRRQMVVCPSCNREMARVK